MEFQNLLKKTSNILKDNLPGILTGIGIVSMGATIAFSINATPKAAMLIEMAEENREEELTKIEKFKLVWKEYKYSYIFGSLSIFCFISSVAINSKRNALLATALALSETTLKDYVSNVKKIVGEKTEKKIRDSISEEKINKSFESNNPVIVTNKGNTLFLDILTGNEFRSDIDTIKKYINELNSEIINHNYISLNDYCYKLFNKYIEIGDTVGWSVNSGIMDVYFSAQLRGDEPAIVINHQVLPINKFDRLY